MPKPLVGLTQDQEIREALVDAAETAKSLSPHVRAVLGAVWGSAIASLLANEAPSETELRAIHARIRGAHDFALQLNNSIANARGLEVRSDAA